MEYTLAGDGGPAILELAGLEPDTPHDLVVAGRRAAQVRTLPALPGPERCRFATLSDLHVGDGWTFGILPTVRDRARGGESPVERAAAAAVSELTAWGAELLVAKGDLTHRGRPDEWRRAAELLRATGLPVVATVGNHDVKAGAAIGTPLLAEHGVDLAFRRVVVRDLPGIRVVTLDAARLRRHTGSFAVAGREALEAAAATTTPVVVALHHDIQRLPFPTHWPPGALGPGSGRFLRALREANPNAVVTSGHTHRNRARVLGGVLVTEVGSPKDHPGGWAGYVVHDGGIRQVVRRVRSAPVLRWTEATAAALFGIWGRWSPGSLADRCVLHHWK